VHFHDIEREIGGLSPERRLVVRQERSAPLLADLRAWMETERRRLSSKSDLGKALPYALGRWTGLARFTADGRLAIDNNAAERALRRIAVTRKILPYQQACQSASKTDPFPACKIDPSMAVLAISEGREKLAMCGV